LDFVATVAERDTAHQDKLMSADDFVDYVHIAGIVDTPMVVTSHQLDRVKLVREAMYGLISALIEGTRPPRRAVAIVNAAVVARRPVATLSTTGRVRRIGDVDAVLAELAHDCIDLYDSPDRDALRWCADLRCSRPFLDRSRGQQRRWCGMKTCGDRAKAAAYRKRHRPVPIP
jgi:predicted RNA-binding Zn ribbon-like protein